MKYKFKITDKKTGETTEKEAMSYKKMLKSLVTPDPKWSGSLVYTNKKGNHQEVQILEGRRYNG
tara:strand:- start:450 stop:641 length:192 start_codon:yes stop_codon:yes gene_type:complete